MEEKKFDVLRYFDDVFEGYEGQALTEKQAKDLLTKCNNRQRYYVSYEMKESKN